MRGKEFRLSQRRPRHRARRAAIRAAGKALADKKGPGKKSWAGPAGPAAAGGAQLPGQWAENGPPPGRPRGCWVPGNPKKTKKTENLAARPAPSAQWAPPPVEKPRAKPPPAGPAEKKKKKQKENNMKFSR